MNGGIVRIDLHGKNCYQAKILIDASLRRSAGVYRLRVIHGFHNGTALKEMLMQEYPQHPRVLRVESSGDGVTDLVLREL